MNKTDYKESLFSISYKKNSEYTCEIIFKRNELSENMFTYIPDSGYYLNKYYKQGNKTVNLSISIKSKNFNVIFNPQYKLSCINGNKNNFNIIINSNTIHINDLKRYISIKKTIHNNIIKITCEYIGVFEIPNRFKKQNPNIKERKQSKYIDLTRKIKSSRQSLGNPINKQRSSGSEIRDYWSTNHPYSGGRFS